MTDIVFLNVGAETEAAGLLCLSVRRSNPGARLVQVTDMVSPAVPGADEMLRFEGAAGELMFFRTWCFAQVPITGPTWFLDTDMLVVRELPEVSGLGLCVREFDNERIINHHFRGLYFGEHKGRRLGEIYPILACTTFVNNHNAWKEIHAILETLPRVYWTWYGDQEALRLYALRHPTYQPLMEGTYACLPEKLGGRELGARILHFKGPARKPLMVKEAAKLGLSRPDGEG